MISPIDPLRPPEQAGLELPKTSGELTIKRSKSSEPLVPANQIPQQKLPQKMQSSLLRSDILEARVAALKQQEKKIEVSVRAAQNSAPDMTPSLHAWLEKNREQVIEYIVEFNPSFKKSATGPLSKPFDLDALSNKLASGELATDFLFKIPNALGDGTGLIWKKTIVDEIVQQYKKMKSQLKKSPDPKLDYKVKTLEAWLQNENPETIKSVKDFALKAARAVPAIFQYSVAAFTSMKTAGGFLLSTGWDLIGTAVHGYKFVKASKDLERQEHWIDHFKDKPLAEKEIGDLLAKRKAAYQQKLEGSRTEFSERIDGILQGKNPWEEVVKNLKAQGVHPEKLKHGETITSIEELKMRIQDTESKETLLKQYVDYKDTIPVSTRNALKALALRKQTTERKFNVYQKVNAGTMFSMAALTASTVIVLKTLAITAAVAIPTIAFTLSGVGMGAAGLILAGVGLYMFYRYRPNTFKAFFQGVHARLILNKIPLAIQEFRMDRKNLEQMKNALKVEQLNAQAAELEGLLKQAEPLDWDKVPVKLKPLLENLQKSASVKLSDSKVFEAQDKLKIHNALTKELQKVHEDHSKTVQEVNELEKSVTSWSGKVTPLKERMEAASMADFIKSAGIGKEDFDLTSTIAEGLTTDATLLDEETCKILREQMGINLPMLQKRFPDKETFKTEIQKALITFYTMDETQLNDFIKKQKLKLGLSF